MYKALYLKVEIKAGGRVDRPSSRSVTSQLMLFEREDAQYSFSLEREGPRFMALIELIK